MKTFSRLALLLALFTVITKREAAAILEAEITGDEP